jgi:hypothetical protein
MTPDRASLVAVSSLLESPQATRPGPLAARAATPPALDVTAIQEKRYPPPRCWSLVADVYTNTLGEDPLQVSSITDSLRQAARAFRLHLHKRAVGLHRTDAPEPFSIVLMWPGPGRSRPHCGVFYEGRVLHATETATLYQDLASMRDSYPEMEFWSR